MSHLIAGWVVRARPARVSHLLLLGSALALASLLLFYGLGDFAPLQLDEATFELFAEQIMAGAKPLSGFFNHYTSALHTYAIALTFHLKGERPDAKPGEKQTVREGRNSSDF